MKEQIELLGMVATVLAVAGVLLNNAKLWPCFLLWMVSNAISCDIHRRKRVWSLVVRDLIFLLLAVAGLLMWTNGQ